MADIQERLAALTRSVIDDSEPVRVTNARADLAAAHETIAVQAAHLEAAHRTIERITGGQRHAVTCSGCKAIPEPREETQR